MPSHLRSESFLFLSTPSARRATAVPEFCTLRTIYFYPRPPRGGRPAVLRAVVPQDGISIHALREEGDKRRGAEQQNDRYFYPRPPRGGRLPKLQQSET